jgi:hypothetical protein
LAIIFNGGNDQTVLEMNESQAAALERSTSTSRLLKSGECRTLLWEAGGATPGPSA